MGRSCPQGLGVEYKHNLKAPDDLMLRQAQDKDELTLLQGPYKESWARPGMHCSLVRLASLWSPSSPGRCSEASLSVAVRLRDCR